MKKITFLFLILLSSCSSNISTMASRMISPESNGEYSGSIDGRLDGHEKSRFNFENEQVGNPVKRKQADSHLGISGDFGIIPKADVFLIGTFGNSPNLLGAKYQFIGENRKKADKGNFSLSAMMAFGSGSSDVGRNDLDYTSSNIKRLKTDTSHSEVGVISGYRWFKQFLQYVNVIYFDQTIEGEVTTVSEQLKHSDFSYEHEGMIYSTGLIFNNSNLVYKMDLSHMVTNWSQTKPNQTSNVASASLGFKW